MPCWVSKLYDKWYFKVYFCSLNTFFIQKGL